MLVLSRKSEQTIMIGSDIVVSVIAIRNNRVKIGIQAPNHVRVLRQELVPRDFQSWDDSQQKAAVSPATSTAMPQTAMPQTALPKPDRLSNLPR